MKKMLLIPAMMLCAITVLAEDATTDVVKTNNEQTNVVQKPNRPQRQRREGAQMNGERAQRQRPNMQNGQQGRGGKGANAEAIAEKRKEFMAAVATYKKDPTAENKAVVIAKLNEGYEKHAEMRQKRIDELKKQVAALEKQTAEQVENKDKFIEEQFEKIMSRKPEKQGKRVPKENREPKAKKN